MKLNWLIDWKWPEWVVEFRWNKLEVFLLGQFFMDIGLFGGVACWDLIAGGFKIYHTANFGSHQMLVLGFVGLKIIVDFVYLIHFWE